MLQSGSVNNGSKSLSFIQIDLQHSFHSMVQLQQTLAERKPDVVLLQEPHVNKFGKLSCIPREYGCFSKIDYYRRFFSAAVLI